MVTVRAKRNFQSDEGMILVGRELTVTNQRAKQLMARRLVEVVPGQTDLHPDFMEAFADVPVAEPLADTVPVERSLQAGSSIFPGGASSRAREFRDQQREAAEEAKDKLSERAGDLREKRRETGAGPTEDPEPKSSKKPAQPAKSVKKK